MEQKCKNCIFKEENEELFPDNKCKCPKKNGYPNDIYALRKGPRKRG